MQTREIYEEVCTCGQICDRTVRLHAKKTLICDGSTCGEIMSLGGPASDLVGLHRRLYCLELPLQADLLRDDVMGLFVSQIYRTLFAVLVYLGVVACYAQVREHVRIDSALHTLKATSQEVCEVDHGFDNEALTLASTVDNSPCLASLLRTYHGAERRVIIDARLLVFVDKQSHLGGVAAIVGNAIARRVCPDCLSSAPVVIVANAYHVDLLSSFILDEEHFLLKTVPGGVCDGAEIIAKIFLCMLQEVLDTVVFFRRHDVVSTWPWLQKLLVVGVSRSSSLAK